MAQNDNDHFIFKQFVIIGVGLVTRLIADFVQKLLTRQSKPKSRDKDSSGPSC